MNEVRLVSDINVAHIGKRLRVQTMEGGFIEGTLAKICHEVKEPFGKFVETWIAFEEFTFVNGRETPYIAFLTIGNRVAEEIVE